MMGEPFYSTSDLAPKLSSALPCSKTTTALACALEDMIRTEGGGSWPPKPTYRHSWPHSLHIYDQVAKQAPPRFVTCELRPNYTDTELRARIDGNRQWLCDALASVKVEQVISTLAQLDANARLGLLACMAYLSHLYRWGTLPVVAMAQDENKIDLPQTIAAPFRWLNEFYGIQSSGGCLFSMTLVNVIPKSSSKLEMAYSNMKHMPHASVIDAERYNAFVFYQMERISLPLYRSMAQCETYLAQGQQEQAAHALKQGHVALKAAFKHFFDTLTEEKMQKAVWMSHAQGFHGWGVDGFDGVSGDHSLLIRTLDALLEIPLETRAGCPFATVRVPVKRWDTRAVCAEATGMLSRLYNWMWPSASSRTASKLATVTCVSSKATKEMQFSEVAYSNDYLPRGQVNWIRSVRQARLRTHASLSPHSPVTAEMKEMAKTLKLWRMGHTRKAIYYEHLDLPERKPMTASGGVGGGVAAEHQGLAQMMEKLEARLRARIAATK